MLYLFAVFLPPVAVLLCGKPFQALLNIGLCLLGIFPGVVHAVLVTHNFYADQRQKRLIDAMRERPPAPPPAP